MTRTLVLMRHGKSGYPEGTPDHDRPLAERGQREAALGGEWIRSTVGTIDAVICSTAVRTRETLGATGIDTHVRFEQRIYGGAPEEIVEEVGFTDDAVSTLLVVGHAPGIPFTAVELAVDPDSEVAQEISRRFPTSAIAVLTFDGPWEALGPGTASLTAFHIPR
ncbi:histidine phosphatase family protein [Rhodococcus sp. G-MC3]|uniref:SixA phosphatase family protein n=1 Tax=Rhodococcus sp. G-MC3 TaxID=3046209 RepID=UPI0024BBC26F|nr:histidine phosphatase family protein [Rhodococcus sp. G-MC3]MDJ0392196.1 histidine phosphatase family protein [Rhodococcus sp. G-MC3]